MTRLGRVTLIRMIWGHLRANLKFAHPRRRMILGHLAITLSLPGKFTEVRCVLPWEFWVLKTEIHFREGAILGEAFLGPEKIGCLELLPITFCFP
jgi:hypothetical protein